MASRDKFRYYVRSSSGPSDSPRRLDKVKLNRFLATEGRPVGKEFSVTDGPDRAEASDVQVVDSSVMLHDTQSYVGEIGHNNDYDATYDNRTSADSEHLDLHDVVSSNSRINVPDIHPTHFDVSSASADYRETPDQFTTGHELSDMMLVVILGSPPYTSHYVRKMPLVDLSGLRTDQVLALILSDSERHY